MGSWGNLGALAGLLGNAVGNQIGTASNMYYAGCTTGNQTQVIYVDVWPSWNGQYQQHLNAQGQFQYQNLAGLDNAYGYAQTPEVIAEQETRRVAAEVAANKAEELLLKILTPKQREQYRMHGWFETEINDKVYRIKKGRAGNVELLGANGRPVERLCAHPEIACPDQDTMVSQLLTLRADERGFRRIANITRLAN